MEIFHDFMIIVLPVVFVISFKSAAAMFICEELFLEVEQMAQMRVY